MHTTTKREQGADWFFSVLEDGALVTLDVKLAYRDDTISEWTEMAHSFEQRKLSCNFTTAKVCP